MHQPPGIITRILKSKVTTDFIYMLVAQIVTMLVAFGINKIVGYYAGVEGYAIFNLVKRSGGVVACIITGGLTVSLPRYLALYSRQKDAYIKRTFLPISLCIFLAHTVVVGAVFLLFPKQIGELLFQESSSHFYLLAITLLFALGQTASNIVFAYYQGLGHFVHFNIFHIVCDVGLLACALIFHSNAIHILLYSYLLLLTLGIALLWKKTEWSSLLALSKKRIRTLFGAIYSYGFTRMLHELVLFLSNTIPLLIILHRFEMEIAGLYTAGLSLNMIIAPIFSFSNSIFLQRISVMSSMGNMRKIKRIIRIFLALYVVVATIGSLGIIVFKEELVILLLSDKFLEALPLIGYFALAIIPNAISQLYKGPLDAVSKVPYNLLSASVKILVLVVLLLTAQSVVDCASGYLYSSIVAAILSFIFWEIAIRKKTHERQVKCI